MGLDQVGSEIGLGVLMDRRQGRDVKADQMGIEYAGKPRRDIQPFGGRRRTIDVNQHIFIRHNASPRPANGVFALSRIIGGEFVARQAQAAPQNDANDASDENDPQLTWL